MLTWRDFSSRDGGRDVARSLVRGYLEEAAGRSLPVPDPMPDELISAAQALGLSFGALRLFCFDVLPRGSVSPRALEQWARERNLARPEVENYDPAAGD